MALCGEQIHTADAVESEMVALPKLQSLLSRQDLKQAAEALIPWLLFKPAHSSKVFSTPRQITTPTVQTNHTE